MSLNETEQLKKLLENSKHILVVFNKHDRGDAVGAALALKTFLEKQHKQAEIAAGDFVLPKNLNFLPGAKDIQSELSHWQKFIIKVDISKAKIDTLSYDIKDNWLSIYLTPRQGTIGKNELRTAQSTYKYDLIITLNTQDLESLGSIFLNNTDLFYRTPIINIDNNPGNEHFGQINLVDLTATSASEIVYKIFNKIDFSILEKTTATALLTGMIAATNSFKTQNVTPITLNHAGQLINLGADREKIIQNLYRTRTIAALKLWGRALTHLKQDSQLKLIFTTLTHEDMARSGATIEELKGVMEELIINSPEAEMVLLLHETDTANTINGLFLTNQKNDARQLLQSLHPEGDKKQVNFSLTNKNFPEAEDLIINLLKENKNII